MADLIADLLAASQQQHILARTARRHGRVDDHVTAITDAERLRREAHSLDPDHLHQAWEAESVRGYDHTALLIFYAAELSKDHIQERAVAKSRLERGLAEVAKSLPARGSVA